MYKVHLRRIIFFSILGIITGLIIAFVSPKIYESHLGLILGGQLRQGAQNLTPDVEEILRLGTAQDPMSEAQLLRGQGVFYRAIENVATQRNDASLIRDVRDLYMMYDVQNERTVNQVSNIAIVGVRAYSPEVAADLANEIGRVYDEIRRKALNDRVNQAVLYLDNQVKLTGDALAKSETQLKAYREKNKIVAMDTAASEVTRRALEYKENLEAFDSELRAVEAQIAMDQVAFNKINKRQEDQQSIGRSAIVAQIEGQLTELKRQKALALTRWYPDSTEVKQLDESIGFLQASLTDELKNREFVKQGTIDRLEPISQRLKNDLIVNKSRRASLKKRLKVIQDGFAANETIKNSIIQDASKVRELERERQIQENNYMRYRSESEDLKNRRDTAGRAAQVFFEAVPDPEPVAPDILKLTLICLIAGACLGTVYSFSLETMRIRIHSSGQLQDLTGLPVAATVPSLPSGALRRRAAALAKGGGSPGESFRYLAVSMLSPDRTSCKSVVFTGVSGANRAFPAIELAASSARIGKRVLLVDADFRDPQTTQMFECTGKAGLQELLSKEALAEGPGSDVAYPTQQTDLFVLPCGSKNAASIADYHFDAVAGLAASLVAQYDLVVFVTPPCDSSSDASLLGSHVDEVFLVASARRTPFRSIPMASELLRRAGAKSVQVVLMEATRGEEPFTATAA